MSNSIILLVGKAYSGKDTIAEYLLQKIPNSIKLALADELKIICQKLIYMFYNISISLDEFYNRKDEIILLYPIFNLKPFCLRSIMQNIGTEIFRHHVSEDIWCDILHKKI